MKKSNRKRFGTFFLSLLLIFCLCAAPVQSAVVHAEEVVDVEENVEQPKDETAEPQNIAGGGIPSSEENGVNNPAIQTEESTQPQTEEAKPDAEPVMETKNASEPEPIADVPEGDSNSVTDDEAVPADAPRLVYGSQELSDDDAFVLLMFGDGFTKDEQEKFYTESKRIADYVMETSPWDEFKDVVKIYAKGVISNESGAKADKAKNQEEADKDTRDTYFKTSFWTGGMQRLLAIGNDGAAKIKALKEKFLPKSDFEVVIVNSETYGGSGGTYCLASLNNESLEMMLHELGHTIANLADEYFAGASYAREYANMTAEKDPEKVKWKRFIGKNGVGVYEYDNGGDGWYRPHQNCKMRFLGQQYAFCEICKEELRRAFCKGSTVTKLFFQTYADILYETAEGKDMSEYFIVRKGSSEATCDTLKDKLHLTYKYVKDAEGNPVESNTVEGIPSKAGTYTIEAVFDGNETYGACTATAEYTIELPDLITLGVESKVYDGEPAALDVKVDYDKEYEVKYHYTGTVPYAAEITYDYNSDEAPIKPGRYTVEVSAYDKASKKKISRKSKDFEITFKSTHVTDNNTSEYPGAQTYYNNKSIVFTGEGFTADEQDKFEKKAAEYIKYFRNTEPYKEADIYFNYSTVEAVSDESGIGKQAKKTYFELTYDDNGKIVLPEDGGKAVQGAMYIGNNVITSYYKAAIVIVNDDNVKKGATFTNKRFTVFAGMDESGMEFAANELLNYFNGDEEGYRAVTKEQKDTQRTQFLKALYYTWYGTDYAPILSRAYDEKFVENGKPVDLAPHFHTYVLGKEVAVKYVITYYADNGGKPGGKLSSAPSKAGTYHAKAELDMGGKSSLPVELDGKTYNLPQARCWTVFTIQPGQTTPPTSTVSQPKTLTLSKTSYTYDGKVKKPSVKVKDTEGKVIPASKYTVTYAKGRKNVGVYSVKVTFKGEYKGTLSGSFKIKPKSTSVKSVKGGKKSMTVKWKKQTKQTTGYQIQYSTKKKFTSGTKTATIKKNKTTSKKITKLNKNKKYYVRIRTYKTVKVNGKSIKIYSSWSKVKSAKTRK